MQQNNINMAKDNNLINSNFFKNKYFEDNNSINETKS